MSKDAAMVICKFKDSDYKVAYMNAYGNLHESCYYVYQAYKTSLSFPSLTFSQSYCKVFLDENNIRDVDILYFDCCSHMTWNELCEKAKKESIKFDSEQPYTD